jgi:3-oxoacyl-[acyl-carrier protein] reductase
MSCPILWSGEIRAAGGEVATLAGDVTKEEDCTALAQFAIDSFGAINLVVPCAGIIRDGLYLAPDRETGKIKGKMALDVFKSVIDINLNGVFLTVRECSEQMINHDCAGLICLISSTGSLGTAGQINYSSTKAAMSVFPKVITAEFFRKNLAHRIRCVAVAPGYVGTVEPEEVASLIGELYRNEAVNGEVYWIHGGLRLGSKG